MNLQEFLKFTSLLPITLEILGRIESETGKGFDVQLNPKLPVLAKVKIARSLMPCHIILVKQKKGSFFNHYLAHECGHILRYYEVSPDKRKTVHINNQSLNKAIEVLEEENGDFLKKIPLLKRYQVIPIWAQCLINQITSLPMDIFIEKWLFDTYPALREEQIKSLQLTYNDAIKALDPNAFTQTPASVRMRTNAMNYAFFKYLDQFLGSSFFSVFAGSSVSDLGEKLYHYIQDENQGLESDIVLINNWVETLGLEGWFTWGDFEDVGEDYEKYYL